MRSERWSECGSRGRSRKPLPGGPGIVPAGMTRPASQVLGLSADDGAGNARARPSA